MKTLFFYFFIFLSIYACKIHAQSSYTDTVIIDIKYKDIFIFNTKGSCIYLLNSFYTEKTYNQKKNIIGIQRWVGDGFDYIKKEYSFIYKKDTMNIICNCKQYTNIYFKNLEFKKGTYELLVHFELYRSLKKIISGNQIKTPKEVQNILFRNAYPWGENGDRKFGDMYFKDLKFIEINLADTVNVKLRKVNDEDFKDWRK
jgi:hypothetical protein